MRFEPIPTPNFNCKEGEDPFHYLRATQDMWKPFLGKMARRSHESVDIMIDKIKKGELQLGLVYDHDGNACAVLGFQYRNEHDGLTCEIVHLTGRCMKEWKHLLPQMHNYLKDQVGCAVVRTYCRRGLERFLTGSGYKKTHVILEHRL